MAADCSGLLDSRLGGRGHEPMSDDTAYRGWGRFFVSVFIAYHAAVLLEHNLPSTGPTRGLHLLFDQYLQASRYLEATAMRQNWGMFAPNPPKENVFIRVLVEDQAGGNHDMGHDTYGRGAFPYLLYSPMRGKVNGRLDERRSLRLSYAAWVCREWEREHGGQPARAVRFVRLWTFIPGPEMAYAKMSFDPRELELNRRELERVECSTAVNGQLPPYLRERYGFAPAPPGTFRPVRIRSWVGGAAPENVEEPAP